MESNDKISKPRNPERVKEIENEILNLWVPSKKHSYWEIGRLLYEARPEFAYKEGFMRWVDEKFGYEFKYRSARYYMRIYECCPKKDMVNYFPLKFLRKICAPTFPQDLRDFLLENREKFNRHLGNEEFDRIVENVGKTEFDPEDPEIQELFKDRAEKARQDGYFGRVKQHLEYKQAKYDFYRAAEDDWMSAANAKLPPDEDGKIKLTREMEEMAIVGKLRELGYMPEYELID
jgi:hypothetical protein